MHIDEVGKGHDSLDRGDEFGLDPYFPDIYSYLRATEVRRILHLLRIWFSDVMQRF